MRGGGNILAHTRNEVNKSALAFLAFAAVLIMICFVPFLSADSTPHTVTFDANGGTVVHEDGVTTDDDLYAPTAYDSQYIPSNHFTVGSETYTYSRTNYVFKGWAKSPTAISPDYIEGNIAHITELSPSGYRLYAVWEPELFDITLYFDENYQAVITMPFQGKYDTSAYISSYTPPTGFRTVGWSTIQPVLTNGFYVIPDGATIYTHIISLERENTILYPIFAYDVNVTNTSYTVLSNGCFLFRGETPSNAIIIGDGTNEISPCIYIKDLVMDFTDTVGPNLSPMIIKNHATANLTYLNSCTLTGRSYLDLGNNNCAGYAAINVQTGSRLIITAQSIGTLTANGGSTYLIEKKSNAQSATGIGANGTSNGYDGCGSIEIYAKTVRANGGFTKTSKQAQTGPNNTKITSGSGIGGEGASITIGAGAVVYATSGQVYLTDKNGNIESLWDNGNTLEPLYVPDGTPNISPEATVIKNDRSGNEIVAAEKVQLTFSMSAVVNPASMMTIGDVSIDISGMTVKDNVKLKLPADYFKSGDSFIDVNISVMNSAGDYYIGTTTHSSGSGDISQNYSVSLSSGSTTFHGTVLIYKGDDVGQTPILDLSNDFGTISPYETYAVSSDANSSMISQFAISLNPGYSLEGVYKKLDNGAWVDLGIEFNPNSRNYWVDVEITLSTGNGSTNHIAFDIGRKVQTVTINNSMYRGGGEVFPSGLITSSSNDPALIPSMDRSLYTQEVQYGESRTYTVHLYNDDAGNPVRILFISVRGEVIVPTDNGNGTFSFAVDAIEADVEVNIVLKQTVKVKAYQAAVVVEDDDDIPVSVTIVDANGVAVEGLVWYPTYCEAVVDKGSSVYFIIGQYDIINYGVSRIDIQYSENAVTLGATIDNFYAIPDLSADTTVRVTMGRVVHDVEYESDGVTRLIRVVDGTIISVPELSQFSSIVISKSGNDYIINQDGLPIIEGYDIDYWLLGETIYQPGSQMRVSSDLHLLAVWKSTAHEYTISYDLAGGRFNDGQENPTSYDINSQFTLPYAPVRTGYTFVGWTGSNGDVPQMSVTIDGSVTAENLSFTANWTPLPITVTYRDELNKNTLGSHTYKFGDPYTGLPICSNFVTDGVSYTFAGWATSLVDDVYGEKITNTTRISNPANHTIYVIWIPDDLYIINILDNGNGGTVVPSANMDTGGAMITLAITPYPGYEANHLFINGVEDMSYDGSSSYDINIPITTSHVVSVRVVFEHTRQTLTVHYGINDPQDIRITTFYVDSEPIFITRSEVGTYDGYRFIGWKWQVDGEWYSETEYILIPTGTVGDFHYYEEWQRIIYTVSYELYDVGQNSPNNPETYISGYTVILEDPTSEVYTFVGWYLDENFENGPIHEISSNMSGDITLYAKWLKIRVFFDPNGGTGEEMEPLQGAPTDEVLLPDCDYYYEGRLFIEWNTVLDGSGTPYAPGQTITLGNSDVRLYAIWYIIVTKPSAIQNHTYDGVTVTITADTGYSVSGATSATYWREGGYTTTFELADGYVWDDYTYNPIVCNWQIMKRTAFIAANSYYVRHGSSTNDAPSYYTLGLVSGDFTIAPGDVDTDAIGSFRNAITYQVSNARSAFAQQIMGSYDLVIIDGYVIVYDEDSSTVAVDIVNGSRSLSMQMGLSAPRMMAVPNRRFV